MPEVVSNTSPLQYLHQLKLISLLPEFYQKVWIPQAVAEEIKAGLDLGVSLPAVEEHSWIQTEAVKVGTWPLPRDIHLGEAEAIALAKQKADSLLILDDGVARQHARAMGLRITGTMGVLIRAKLEGKVPAVRPLLARLNALGFRIDKLTEARVLALANEQA